MSWKIKTGRQIPPGTYPARLIDVCEAQKNSWNDETRSFDGPLKDTIKFTYEVELSDETIMHEHHCNATNSSKGTLVNWLKMSNPREYTEAVRVSVEKIEKFAKALVGKDYLLTWSLTETGSSKLTNVLMSPTVAKVRGNAAQTQPVADDDIPF